VFVDFGLALRLLNTAIGTSNSSGTTYPHRGSLHSHHSSATEGFGRSMIYPDISWWKKKFYCWFSPWYIWIDSNDYNLYFHHDISIQSVIDSIRIYLLLMPVYPKIYLTGIPQARKCSSGRLSMEWHDESLSQIPSRRRGVTSGQGVNLP
jgi:hypothetical protein